MEVCSPASPRWFQALVLFTQQELTRWKEMKDPRQAASSTAADANESGTVAHLLFLNELDKPMNVSFHRTMKEKVGLIAMYGLKKFIHNPKSAYWCLIGFVIVYDVCTLQSILKSRSVPRRTNHISMAYISHTDIMKVQDFTGHLSITKMSGHILDQTVSHGLHLSESSFASYLKKWPIEAASVLHLWIALRYILTGYGEKYRRFVPVVCLEQVVLSGIPPDGDGSPAYSDSSCMNDLVSCLKAVEFMPSAEHFFQKFVQYINHDYTLSIDKLKAIEEQFCQQDDVWKRFTVLYTERSRQLWSSLSELPSLSLATVETFIRERLIPKHDELFGSTPYDHALNQASVSAQPVEVFCLYTFEESDEDGLINVHWQPPGCRKHQCIKYLQSFLDTYSPGLCGNPELSAFALCHRLLLMESSNEMCYVYPFTGTSVDLTTVPSTASIVALLVGRERLSSLMKGHATLTSRNCCFHEVTNPLLNISTVVADVDISAQSSIITKIRQSDIAMKQFCSELKENARKVLRHLEIKCTLLKGLAQETKHLIFRTEPANRTKEGFHHLIVFPDWLCLQNIAVASDFINLLDITRSCMPLVGQQGVEFDNIYKSPRHAMRLPFQCKSKGKYPLLLVHSDYGEEWDVSKDLGSLFIHGPKHEERELTRNRVLVDDISGINLMSETSGHFTNAVFLLRQRNKVDSQQSYKSLLDRFGDDLNCSSVEEISTLVERAFERTIARKFVMKVNSMGLPGYGLCVEHIKLGWLKEKELMTVGKGMNRYMDVCIAKEHQDRQSCIYYICVQKYEMRIRAVLYLKCFSTNCVAWHKNIPYNTGFSAVLT